MSLNASQKVAAIVADAGGRIVGRTRLQKVSYLLTVVGFESGLAFRYKHYGPYSEELAKSAATAVIVGDLREEEAQASWGGTYSTYTTLRPVDAPSDSIARRKFASAAASADAIELELAATAVFLFRDGCKDPWKETARRKPEKAEDGRIEKARSLLRNLSQISTPDPLPEIWEHTA